MCKLKSCWSEAMSCLESPPSDMRSWLKIGFAVTIFSLLWGLMVTGIIIRSYSLEPPEINWNLPSAMHLVGQMMGVLGETAIAQWWLIALTVILCGRKRVGILLMVALPASLYFGMAHYELFRDFAGRNMAIVCAAALQGVLFLVWGLLFVKCVDAKSQFQFKALAAVSFSHFLYNIFIIRLIAFCW
ncbi:MAG: hypothetical protein Q7S83_01230 [bacterium]|nr:hypothetical protein [bacterium]